MANGDTIAVPTESTGIGDRKQPLHRHVFISLGGSAKPIANTWPSGWLISKVHNGEAIPLWIPPNIVMINDPNRKALEKFAVTCRRAMASWKAGDLANARDHLEVARNILRKDPHPHRLLDILARAELGLIKPTWDGADGMKTGNLDQRVTEIFKNGWWEQGKPEFLNLLRLWQKHAPSTMDEQLAAICQSTMLDEKQRREIIEQMISRWYGDDAHDSAWECAARLDCPLTTAAIASVYRPPERNKQTLLLATQVAKHTGTPYREEVMQWLRVEASSSSSSDMADTNPIWAIATTPDSVYQEHLITRHLFVNRRLSARSMKIIGLDFPRNERTDILFDTLRVRTPTRFGIFAKYSEAYRDLAINLALKTSGDRLLSRWDELQDMHHIWIDAWNEIDLIKISKPKNKPSIDDAVEATVTRLRNLIDQSIAALLKSNNASAQQLLADTYAKRHIMPAWKRAATTHGLEWFACMLQAKDGYHAEAIALLALKSHGNEALPLIQTSFEKAMIDQTIDAQRARNLGRTLVKHLSDDQADIIRWRLFEHPSHTKTGARLLSTADRIDIDRFLNHRSTLSSSQQEAISHDIANHPSVPVERLAEWLLLFDDRPLANAALHALRSKTDIPFDFSNAGQRINQSDWLTKRRTWLSKLKDAGVVPSQ